MSFSGSLGAIVEASGPDGLVILIGGIVLILGLTWDQVAGFFEALGLEGMEGGGTAIFFGFLLIGLGIVLAIARRR